jgi:hypothetical protein
MARIRSVHPGLFTDEAFATLSDAAQIFAIGLWTECDDQGAFEWKPFNLRMRLRPGKDGSVEPLLAELEAANMIRSYEHEGRKFGLVRNFRKYQRPKKPNAVHFIPPELLPYVGLKPPSSEPAPHYSEVSSELRRVHDPGSFPETPSSGGIAPQMEEEGGRKKEGSTTFKDKPSSAVAARDQLEHRLREAAGWEREPHPGLCVTGPIEALIAKGVDLEKDVLPVVKAKAAKAHSRTSWNFFVAAIVQAFEQRIGAGNKINGSAASASKPIDWKTFTRTDYEGLVQNAVRRREWPKAWGPTSSIPSDLVTPELRNIIG